jgi:hypothetical protein
MACSKCKNKNNTKDELMKTTDFISKGTMWFIVGWSMLAVYGLYTLITKLI